MLFRERVFFVDSLAPVQTNLVGTLDQVGSQSPRVLCPFNTVVQVSPCLWGSVLQGCLQRLAKHASRSIQCSGKALHCLSIEVGNVPWNVSRCVGTRERWRNSRRGVELRWEELRTSRGDALRSTTKLASIPRLHHPQIASVSQTFPGSFVTRLSYPNANATLFVPQCGQSAGNTLICNVPSKRWHGTNPPVRFSGVVL